MEYQIESGIKGFSVLFSVYDYSLFVSLVLWFFELISTLDFPQNSVGKICRGYCMWRNLHEESVVFGTS